MIEQRDINIEELIVQEKRQLAMEYIKDAWHDGIYDGIETEIMAETAMATALDALLKYYSEDRVQKILDDVKLRLSHGEFTEQKSFQ